MKKLKMSEILVDVSPKTVIYRRLFTRLIEEIVRERIFDVCIYKVLVTLKGNSTISIR